MLDFILYGAGAGAGTMVIAQLMAGRVPGDNLIISAAGGAMMGAILYIFFRGMA